VIGIVASRLIERYYRPTVMITIENGQGKGSARAIAKFDIYQALKSCSDLLLQFGGHKYAAGLTIAAENIPEFKKRFEAVCREMIPEEDLVPKIKIESEISLDEITPEAIGFNLGEHIDRVSNHARPLEMVYAVEENEYNNRKTVQLRIKDLR
jgi:single-stranded-DNA-specific exonuclease